MPIAIVFVFLVFLAHANANFAAKAIAMKSSGNLPDVTRYEMKQVARRTENMQVTSDCTGRITYVVDANVNPVMKIYVFRITEAISADECAHLCYTHYFCRSSGFEPNNRLETGGLCYMAYKESKNCAGDHVISQGVTDYQTSDPVWLDCDLCIDPVPPSLISNTKIAIINEELKETLNQTGLTDNKLLNVTDIITDKLLRNVTDNVIIHVDNASTENSFEANKTLSNSTDNVDDLLIFVDSFSFLNNATFLNSTEIHSFLNVTDGLLQNVISINSSEITIFSNNVTDNTTIDNKKNNGDAALADIAENIDLHNVTYSIFSVKRESAKNVSEFTVNESITPVPEFVKNNELEEDGSGF